MKLQLTKDIGKIRINDNVFGQIAENAIERAGNNAWLCSKKGKLIGTRVLTGKHDYSQAVETSFSDGKISCNIFIICRFGKSIKQTSKIIIDSVKKDISIIGEVGEVKVSIRGILSKHLAKRKMEIKE